MTSLYSLLRLCLLVLLFALSTTSTAAQYNISSMTGGAGCVLGSTPPLSCTFPATVSVNFTASSPPWSSNSTCYITFLGQGGQFIIAYGNPSPADPTNHTVAFSLFAYAYQTALMSRPLSAYVVCDSSGAIASPAFTAGPTFSLVPPPALTSTSGCALTSPAIGAVGCQLTDQLTIHGSSFTILGGISSVAVSLDGFVSSVDGVTVVDDGTLTLALLPLQLPSASFFNTSVVSNLSIVTQWPSLLPPGYGSYQTNSVTLTFAPLAGPPLITQWYADIQDTSIPQLQYPPRGCVIDNPAARLSNYSGCYPSVVEVYSIAVTSVYVFGTNLFGGSLSIYQSTLGSVACLQDPTSSNDTYPSFLRCSLPAIAGNQPGMRYDIVVQTPTGSMTLPSAFSYTTQPIVASVDSCYNDGVAALSVFTRSGCPPNAVITVRGMNFPLNNTVVVTVWDGTTAVNCQTPKVTSAGAITCLLAAVPVGAEVNFYGIGTILSVQFVQSGVLSNITAIVYSLPDLPVITNITGTCLGQSGPLTVSSCRALDRLTITGQYFFTPFDTVGFSLAPITSYSSPVCGVSLDSTNTTLFCQFDSLNYQPPFNVSLPYALSTIVGPNFALWQSNPVFVSFINATAPTVSNAALSISPQHGAVGVLTVLAVVALVCMTGW